MLSLKTLPRFPIFWTNRAIDISFPSTIHQEITANQYSYEKNLILSCSYRCGLYRELKMCEEGKNEEKINLKINSRRTRENKFNDFIISLIILGRNLLYYNYRTNKRIYIYKILKIAQVNCLLSFSLNPFIENKYKRSSIIIFHFGNRVPNYVSIDIKNAQYKKGILLSNL